MASGSFSEQLSSQQTQTKPTRTERKISRREYEDKKAEQQRLQTEYNQLKKEYDKKAKESAEAKKYLVYVRRANQGKPFWGWGLSRKELQLVNDLRTGRRKIEDVYPNVDPEYLSALKNRQNQILEETNRAGKNYNQVGVDPYDKPIYVKPKNQPNSLEQQYQDYSAGVQERKQQIITDYGYDVSGFNQVTREQRGTYNPSQPQQYVIGETSDKSFLSFVGGIPLFSTGVKVWKGTKERVHFDLAGGVTTPKISVKFGKLDDPTDIDQGMEDFRTNLAETNRKIDRWTIGDEKDDPLKIGASKVDVFKQGLDEKYTRLYQNAFEEQQGRSLIVDQYDFEKAKQDFMNSKKAKELQERYAREYGEGYKELEVGVDFWSRRGIIGGIAKTGVNLAYVGSTLVDNPVDLATTGLVLYGGTSAIKSLPTIAKIGLNLGFTGYGTITAFDPTKTYSERGAGLITAGIGATTLAYSGYRYLNRPVLPKRIKIPSPVKDLETYPVGDDVKLLTDSRKINAVNFGQQKLGQYGFEGSRQVVTTKWRSIYNDFVTKINRFQGNVNIGGIDINFNNLNLKTLPNIYEGIPANQPATYLKITGFKGNVNLGGIDLNLNNLNFKIKTGLSGYEKASKLLKSYGYSQSQITEVLRYNSPRVLERWLESGTTVLTDTGAVKKFTYTTRQPAIEVDKNLNIKTRGARTIQDKYLIDAKMVTINDKEWVIENQRLVSNYLDKGGNIVKGKGIKFSQTKTMVSVSDLKNLEIQGTELYDPTTYKDLAGVGGQRFSIEITPYTKKTDIDILMEDTKPKFSRSMLIDKEIDLRTPIEKTIIQKGKPSKIYNYNPTSEQSIKQAINKLLNPTKTQTTTQTTTLINKQLSLPPVQETITRPIWKVKDAFEVGVKSASALDVGLSSAVISASGLDLDQDNDLKNILKNIDALKLDQSQKNQLKTTPAQQGRTMLGSSFALPPLSPIFQMPIITLPTLKTPPTATPKFTLPVIFGANDRLKKKIKKKGKKKDIFGYGAFPDFTARAIGLKSKQVGSVKEALKELKKIRSGFGIRTGLTIKKQKKFNEKNLLKGIMK